ncbi:MAG TPA: hypothetical protein VFB38_20615 [Chthonomonadaceae bacterium]|nr:hypothetical protein [Chthonomonadaceae bacterium]
MRRIKLGTLAAFVFLCLGISTVSHAQGWTASDYSGYTITSTLTPQNDPDARSLSITTTSVSASSQRPYAQAYAMIYAKRTFTWTGALPVPALTLTFSGYESGSASGTMPPFPLASSTLQPNPSTRFPPASFSAPPTYGGTVTYDPWQATAGGVSPFTASMQISANAQNLSASAFTSGAVASN